MCSEKLPTTAVCGLVFGLCPPPPPPTSSSTQGTWHQTFHNLLSEMTFNLGGGWLKWLTALQNLPHVPARSNFVIASPLHLVR